MSMALRTRTPLAPSFFNLLDLWDVPAARRAPSFAPAFAVKETAEAFVLSADLPGVAEADLEISVHADVLTVRGSRAAPAKLDGERAAFDERAYGTFERRFTLGETADADKVSAALANGVLTVTVGKKAEAKPRKIAIR